MNRVLILSIVIKILSVIMLHILLEHPAMPVYIICVLASSRAKFLNTLQMSLLFFPLLICCTSVSLPSLLANFGVTKV